MSNRNVELPLEDYGKAIAELSFPNMISMFVQTIYSLVDAIWITGLEDAKLAAMVFFFFLPGTPFGMLAYGMFQ